MLLKQDHFCGIFASAAAQATYTTHIALQKCTRFFVNQTISSVIFFSSLAISTISTHKKKFRKEENSREKKPNFFHSVDIVRSSYATESNR